MDRKVTGFKGLEQRVNQRAAQLKTVNKELKLFAKQEPRCKRSDIEFTLQLMPPFEDFPKNFQP
jgi:hypothetical protein